VREESHLDEMRDAIRGDFERLAERRGEQELMRVTEPEEVAVAEEPAPEPEQEAEAEPEPLPEPGPEEPERRSWLARLFST
jgi:hypothetical protein